MNVRNLLLISYSFPPVGGPGVQRTLKYVKYLPRFGWRPLVLTVKPRLSYVQDPSLVREVPASVEVYPTESLDPFRIAGAMRSLLPHRRRGSATGVQVSFAQDAWLVRLYRRVRDVAAFPDAVPGWIPFLLERGVRVARERRVDAIMARVLPYSSAIAASILSLLIGKPFLLDFADGWLDYPYLPTPSPLHRWGHRRLESAVVQRASAVMVCSHYLRDGFLRRYPGLRDRLDILTNGFDPEDLVVPQRLPGTRALRTLVYMGSLYDRYHDNLLALLSALKNLPVELASNLEVLFVGQYYQAAEAAVRAHGLETRVKFLGYRPHQEAISILARASAGLLFLPKGDRQAITGKVFEYLMLGLPIAAGIEPDGELASILRQVGAGDWIVPVGDSDGMAAALLDLHKRGWPVVEAKGLDRYSRLDTTRRLAGWLHRVADHQARR